MLIPYKNGKKSLKHRAAIDDVVDRPVCFGSLKDDRIGMVNVHSPVYGYCSAINEMLLTPSMGGSFAFLNEILRGEDKTSSDINKAFGDLYDSLGDAIFSTRIEMQVFELMSALLKSCLHVDLSKETSRVVKIIQVGHAFQQNSHELINKLNDNLNAIACRRGIARYDYSLDGDVSLLKSKKVRANHPPAMDNN